MSTIDHALRALDPITLHRANEIAELQTRVDRKYVVDERTLVALLQAMAPTAQALEIDGHRSCRYRSTYFDTECLTLYRATVQGRRRRFKIRTRTYGESGPAFLEVKAKGRRGRNDKSRIGYDRSHLDEITPGGQVFIEGQTGQAGLGSLLRPVLTTAYERSTLIDPATRTRLTFDRNLCCTLPSGDSAARGPIVVETKSTCGPSPADSWLRRNRHRPVALSKFCTGLAAVRPDLPANKWRAVIDHHWRPLEATAA